MKNKELIMEAPARNASRGSMTITDLHFISELVEKGITTFDEFAEIVDKRKK